MTKSTPIAVKRVYDLVEHSDGQRVLVDRLWPRGIAKEGLHHDAWFKPLAPSACLRKWFGHDPAKWAEFRRRYFRELGSQSEAVAQLLALCRRGRVTLLFSAKDRAHNNAVALRDHLLEISGKRGEK